MRQMAALLSFWQNGSASDHFREGKRGSKSDSSKQTCIAQAVRPAVLRGRVCPERCAAGYLCPSHRLSSPLWNVAAQPCRGRIAGACVQALFLVWHTANRICAKRLIPFLSTLVEALERHEHLHLTEECRRQLLSMSAATADRLLRSQREGVSAAPPRCERVLCSSSRSQSAPSRSGGRPDLAFWRRT